MTRKDYVAIAGALRTAMIYTEAIAVGNCASEIANAMQDDNPRFDREHFLAVVRGERELNSRPKREAVPYQPKTGQRCGCRPGLERDNCSRCEGTGMVIDFAAIRAMAQ